MRTLGYYSTWSENRQLYIQMELCDHSLSINNCPPLLTERHEIEAYTGEPHFIYTPLDK